MISFSQNGLTTLLFHRFMFEGDSLSSARDRLRRQCDWLSKNFSPQSLDDALRGLADNSRPPRPLLITIDDAKIEILEFADVFAEFNLPVTIFVCVGWSARETPDEDTLLSRLVNDIQWYAGPPLSLATKWGQLLIGVDTAQTARSIDLILAGREQPVDECEAVLSRLQLTTEVRTQRVSCSWQELAQLKAAGTAIGGHSVSHVRLASATPARLWFEISETRRVLEARLGLCSAFAYPYGMAGTHNDLTRQELVRAGFRHAFLTHSAYAYADTDLFQLPRISMPDRSMGQFEFCLRSKGVGIPYRKLKRALGGLLSRNN